jgi:heat shock protein HslJ
MVDNETIPEDSGMYVRFAVDGSIEANGGCNGFFGSLEQTETGLAFGPLGATRMACPEPIMSREAAFLDALQRTRNIESGKGRMSLLDGGNGVLVEFVAVLDE